MLVNTNTILNYNRCRRFAALNDPFTSIYTQSNNLSKSDSLFNDIFLSHLYSPVLDIKKNVNLTYEFDHNITLLEEFDFMIDDDRIYCLLPYSSKEFLKLKYKVDNHKYQMFTKNANGIYTLRTIDKQNKDFQMKSQKLFSTFESIGKIVFSYALKNYVFKNVYPNIDYNLYFVLFNSDYIYDGISYTDKLYHLFDFSNIENLDEIVEIALFRMINHLELNDFTPCPLVKKACLKDKPSACKFVDFCYSHLPKNTSILDYFNSHLGFDEVTDYETIHHDEYDLLNEGYVSMQDIPISWLENQNHLMQRYCVDNQKLYFHKRKIEAGLLQLHYPIYYLDFEAMPSPIPLFRGEKPYSQSVFQFSVHVETNELEYLKIDSSHYNYISKPNRDNRLNFLKELIAVLGNNPEASIVVYNKTFEKTRLLELSEVFPEYKKQIDQIINRLFDLLDIVKMNKSFYADLGFNENDLETYNLYHIGLGGSYSLKKVIKVFNDKAYSDLEIVDGVMAYKAYAKLREVGKVEQDLILKNLMEYCRQDTYSMYEIVQGLKKLIGPDFRINNS